MRTEGFEPTRSFTTTGTSSLRGYQLRHVRICYKEIVVLWLFKDHRPSGHPPSGWLIRLHDNLRAGDGSRTHDLWLGKPMPYHLATLALAD